MNVQTQTQNLAGLHIRAYDFEQTCALLTRMHAQPKAPTRSRIGALEYIAGTVTDDRTHETIRTAVCVDPATGGSIVTQWPDDEVDA